MVLVPSLHSSSLRGSVWRMCWASGPGFLWGGEVCAGASGESCTLDAVQLGPHKEAWEERSAWRGWRGEGRRRHSITSWATASVLGTHLSIKGARNLYEYLHLLERQHSQRFMFSISGLTAS